MANQLALGDWQVEDLPLLQRLMGDPVMMKYLGGPESPDKIRGRNQRYAELAGTGKGRMFVITEDGRAAGSIGYWEREEQSDFVWETGWSVLPEFQGQGIATVATELVIIKARKEASYRWLYAYPTVENAASNAICRKVGFELVGENHYEYPPGNPVVCNNWRFDLFAKVGDY